MRLGRFVSAVAVPPSEDGTRSGDYTDPSRRAQSPGLEVALEDFEVLDVEDGGRQLGKGSFGVVRRIRLRGTDDVYALKGR
ncbi:unnamed protein product [Prorocentrum cordatum]|uniref:Non-specific serine/threonine protein kinase n=1 Tax=Prorocentrum cordatum TaxID=2364126 RepID=A0ABN9T3N1_9DINO|nr:unnamed protein product [Polarella glacialis]